MFSSGVYIFLNQVVSSIAIRNSWSWYIIVVLIFKFAFLTQAVVEWGLSLQIHMRQEMNALHRDSVARVSSKL